MEETGDLWLFPVPRDVHPDNLYFRFLWRTLQGCQVLERWLLDGSRNSSHCVGDF